MIALQRFACADQLVAKGLAEFDAIMAAHIDAQVAKMRAADVPEDQIEAVRQSHDEQHAKNRIEVARELWVQSLALLSTEGAE